MICWQFGGLFCVAAFGRREASDCRTGGYEGHQQRFPGLAGRSWASLPPLTIKGHPSPKETSSPNRGTCRWVFGWGKGPEGGVCPLFDQVALQLFYVTPQPNQFLLLNVESQPNWGTSGWPKFLELLKPGAEVNVGRWQWGLDGTFIYFIIYRTRLYSRPTHLWSLSSHLSLTKIYLSLSLALSFPNS